MDRPSISPLEVLQKHWGYDGFRPFQESIIDALLAGRDVWAQLATSAGKSICFQVPTLCYAKGLCLVVSPLIALMHHQVRDLTKRGIRAQALDASLNSAQWDGVLRGCEGAQTRFLYISAERIGDEAFLKRLQALEVVLVVVDEAHCISEWGHDFRPAYQQLGRLRDVCPEVPVFAASASASKAVATDVKESLALANALEIRGSLARPNLSYAVRQDAQIEQKLCRMLATQAGSALIYVASRNQSENWSRRLQQKGFKAQAYHAGLSLDKRHLYQNEWLHNKVRILVCTTAFGMGIDKPDVRWVIHLSPPHHLSAYVQESGRAGRDGKRAYAVLLLSPNALKQAQERIQQQIPDLPQIRRIYDALYNYAKIAIGSGAHYSCKLPIQSFANTYQENPADVYRALEYLAFAGLIQLDTRGCPYSQVHILVDKTDVYRFQVAHARAAPVLDALMRQCPGVFTTYCLLDEARLARHTRMPQKVIIDILKQAQQAQIIRYIPRHHTPLLTFLLPRQLAQTLPLNEDDIQKKRHRKVQALDEVTGYITQTNQCRQQTIAQTLDNPIDTPCGLCDNCLSQKK